jgi:hypothetical protein
LLSGAGTATRPYRQAFMSANKAKFPNSLIRKQKILLGGHGDLPLLIRQFELT